jgi:predicted phosphodiesterase
MRFLHTADWQIGMKAAHVGDAGAAVRAARFDAAKRVVAAAREHDAEFILVAGDTFEHNAVPRADVQRVADILGGFPGPVYLISGNHDPLVSGAVWEHSAWAGHGNLEVLRDAAPVEIPGGILFPCPAKSRHSLGDPTAWIPARDGDGLRVGLAHGTIELPHIDDRTFPIPVNAATARDLDYLALGHWHSTLIVDDGRVAYSGTHETTAFGERDSGNALLVTLQAGAAPRIEALRTGGLRWVSLGEDLTVGAADDLEDVRGIVDGLADPDAVLLRVALTGILPSGALGLLQDLEDLMAARFLFSELDLGGLIPSPDDPGWIGALAEDAVEAAVARRLLELADAGAARGELPAAVATEALQLLYRLLREVER